VLRQLFQKVIPSIGINLAIAARFFLVGGPARTRTWDQGIHFALSFLTGVDYLTTRYLINGS
jgi:hypothetical protein